ncbi:MAG: helix-turn-helix domain-containing protein [Acidobacteriia bacterium]|nr:helix-turn-helix domain-containing protein [Terriglobia bacterium]
MGGGAGRVVWACFSHQAPCVLGLAAWVPLVNPSAPSAAGTEPADAGPSSLIGACELDKTIGKKLQLIRIEKGLSQGDIEKRTGLLRSYLSRVENGHTIPSLDTLGKIAAALEVGVSELLEAPVGERAKTASLLGDKRQARFWNLMRKYVPQLKERDRRLLVGLARRMVGR